MELGESRASAGLAHGVMKAAADLCIYDTISCFVFYLWDRQKSMILASSYRVGKEVSTYLNASVYLLSHGLFRISISHQHLLTIHRHPRHAQKHSVLLSVAEAAFAPSNITPFAPDGPWKMYPPMWQSQRPKHPSLIIYVPGYP